MGKLSIALTLLFLAILSYASAQNGEGFSEKKWEKLTEGIDYTQEKKKPEPIEERDRTDRDHDNDSGSSSRSSGGSPVFQGIQGMGMVFVIIAGVVILGLIIFIIANSKSNPTLAAQNVEIEKIENIEESIHEVNLDDLFGRFVAGGDYNLALRMSFLMIIKTLSEQKLIRWEKQKTNWEYHGELSDYDLKYGFGSMINVFERMWYGEQVITEPEFHQIESEFNQFKSRLGEKE